MLGLTPGQLAGADQDFAAVQEVLWRSVASVATHQAREKDPRVEIWIALARELSELDHVRMCALFAAAILKLSEVEGGV